MKSGMITLLIFSFTLIVQATIIHVPATKPSISDALEIAAEGDTILLAHGTHTQPELLKVNKSIMVASPFIFSGNQADIEKTRVAAGTDDMGEWFELSAENICVVGIRFIGNEEHTLHITAPYASVTHCQFIGGKDQLSITGGGGYIANCYFENAGDDAIDCDESISWTIEYNLIVNAHQDGIEVRLHDKNAPLTTHVFRYNEVIGSGESGIQLIDYEGDSYREFLIHNNLFRSCRGAGVSCMYQEKDNTSEVYRGSLMQEKAYVFNNTFVKCNYGLTISPGLVILNNIFVNLSTNGIERGIYVDDDNDNSIVDYCLFYNNPTDYDSDIKMGTHILKDKDPFLNDNLELGDGSPCIKAGIDQYRWEGTAFKVPSSDYIGSKPDLGAKQFEGNKWSARQLPVIDAGPLPSPIFPIPREMEISGKQFELNEHVVILVPENTSDHDLSLARFLVRELSDRYGIALQTTSTAKLPTQKSFILMGSVNNPLVQEYCQKKKLPISAKQPGPEGYLLNVSEKTVLVAGSDDQGAFYGLQSLRQLIEKDKIAGVKVRDWPRTQFRGIRLYIPGRENITFFKRFLKDFMALYKFNKVVLEVNACMRFDSHPELNAGWIEFANSMHYARRSRPAGPHNQYQDSAHHDAGDGGVLEKAEVKDLVNFATDHYIEVIPEIPTLTHSYYLLSRHRELAEIQSAEWPDTYCPSNPKSYELLFDVLDEYIEVIRPKMIHIGKDEWRMEVNVCSNCTGKDYTELFVSDINKIYQYISGKNINVGMWGDHLLESVREKGFRDRKTSTGYEYQIPGSITPEQVTHEIPKDILLFNWFWGDENNDLALETFGFKQVYGNFRPNISSWEKRSQWKSVLGGAPSSWAATTEFNFGKDLLYDFLGCANLLWSEKSLDHQSLAKTVRQLIPEIRGYLSGRKLPSEDNNTIASVNLSRYFNTSHNQDFAGVKLDRLKTGEIGDKKFILADPKSAQDNSAIVIETGSYQTSNLDQTVDSIEINDDASSLIFLHACAREAGNDKAYRKIYDFEDTADLLGWYEVAYEDGYTLTIPIRYGVNILDMHVNRRGKDGWAEGKTGAPQNVYCYLGEPVECAQNENDSKMFFSFEWKNPRFGKTIKHISLKGTDSFRNSYDKEIPENAIILLAINYTEKRPVPDIKIK